MNKHQYWKNFNLVTELSIAGRFIYNGLEEFHHIRTFAHVDEVFEVLYNLAIGLERTLKICVVLLEHSEELDQDDFERSLITHSHAALMERVIAKAPVKLSAPHHELLALLGRFYKSHRYSRYNLASIAAMGQEKKEFLAYIGKHLSINLSEPNQFFPPQNTEQIKNFLGRTVGKMTTQLYEVIRGQAARLNIYTYEVRTASKAYKIFLAKQFDFEAEDILARELVLSIAKQPNPTGHIRKLLEKPPLEFDFGNGDEHIASLFSNERKLEVMDELEYLYDQHEDRGSRFRFMRLIGNPNVFFNEPEEIDDNPFGSQDDDDIL